MTPQIGDDARQLIERLAAEAGSGRLFVATTVSEPAACLGAVDALAKAAADDEAQVWIGTAEEQIVWIHFVWSLTEQGQFFDAGGDASFLDQLCDF